MGAIEIVIAYRHEFLHGLTVTVQLCAIIWSVGIFAGVLLGAAGARWKLVVGAPSRFISFALSGIPVLVLLFWMYYPLQYLLGVDINPFPTAAATLCIINTFLVADQVRGVLNDFPLQYILAARACGLDERRTLWAIQLPIIFRQVIPNLLFIQVGMLQATLFASLISVNEIFREAQRINALVYRPVEIYSALALFFLAVCLPLHGLAQWLKIRYTRDFSEQ
jgi:His/Glu/Gln/Arg/opine family amino acid ABC transporter permease subunit